SRRRHTRSKRDWSSDVCSSDLTATIGTATVTISASGGGASHSTSIALTVATVTLRTTTTTVTCIPASINFGSVTTCTALVNDTRSEEHTSELQSRFDLVCRLLL